MGEQVLSEPTWHARATAHQARVEAYVGPHLARHDAGVKHPVHDFLFGYYSQRPAQLRRWHAGFGVTLAGGADSHGGLKGYEVTDDGGARVTGVHVQRQRVLLTTLRRLLAATASRAPSYGCFGLHEWAMVYRAEEHRHAMPLRLGGAVTDAVVEASSLRCSHLDAFRFFTDEAVPRNALHPTRQRQPELDHAGCVHVTMDLLKWALKLGPLAPGDLLLACFELARDARTLDMRASPYDVSGYGLDVVAVETVAGRATYAGEQRRLAVLAAPLRQRLLAVCRAAQGVPVGPSPVAPALNPTARA